MSDYLNLKENEDYIRELLGLKPKPKFEQRAEPTQRTEPKPKIEQQVDSETTVEEFVKDVLKLIRPRYKTIIKNIRNEKITGRQTIIQIEGEGILAECRFQSLNNSTDNKSYKVNITSDKNLIYSGSWSDFESRSYYETDLTAYEDDLNGYYILQFKNVAFLEKLLVEVHQSSATFTNIYIKYHENLAILNE